MATPNIAAAVSKMKEDGTSSTASKKPTIEDAFMKVASVVDAKLVSQVQTIYEFEVGGKNGHREVWVVDLSSGEGAVVRGSAKEVRPNKLLGASFAIDEDTLHGLIGGGADPMTLLFTGKLGLTGSKKKAAKLQLLLARIPTEKDLASRHSWLWTIIQSIFGLSISTGDSGNASRLLSYNEDVRGKQHGKYFSRFLDLCPHFLQTQDQNRITLVFFALSGLDILGQLDEFVNADKKSAYINWIYSLQVLPDSSGKVKSVQGFRGGSYLGGRYNPHCKSCSAIPGDGGHLAMTYTALCCLAILGDDFGRLDRKGIATSLKEFQQADGCFSSTSNVGGETDMRFSYCACCIAYMLGDWSGVDREKLQEFIKSSLGYDYGIAQRPGLESHGGSTFCALACLSLMHDDRLHDILSKDEFNKILHWLVSRQKSGYQGRPHKPEDTCYSFWVGSSLRLIGHGDVVDHAANRAFLMTTQNDGGGFAKWPDVMPDPLHAYMGLSGLSLQDERGIAPIHPALNISQRAADQLPCGARGSNFSFKSNLSLMSWKVVLPICVISSFLVVRALRN